MIRPERIGHVVIKVRNLERSRRFYTEVLGMDVMMDLPEIPGTFLANGRRDHHEIALFEIGPDAEAPRAKQIGLSHIAFRLRNEDDLRAAYREFKERGVPISFTVDHGVTKSIYFSDPDGHELEVYCDNSPEEIAKFRNPYMGTRKLDFAPDEPSLTDAISQLGVGAPK
jgi:catechol 2,3-dioxygenase